MISLFPINLKLEVLSSLLKFYEVYFSRQAPLKTLIVLYPNKLLVHFLGTAKINFLLIPTNYIQKNTEFKKPNNQNDVTKPKCQILKELTVECKVGNRSPPITQKGM